MGAMGVTHRGLEHGNTETRRVEIQVPRGHVSARTNGCGYNLEGQLLRNQEMASWGRESEAW